MSHFSDSCSEFTSGSKTKAQLDRFNLLKETFKNNSINLQASSISNSGAIEQNIGLEETHLRPGLMLYSLVHSKRILEIILGGEDGLFLH